MALGPKELEEMEDTLKAAFASARRNFDDWKDAADSAEGKARAVTAVATAASALLQLDERLSGAARTSSVQKQGPKLPGKG